MIAVSWPDVVAGAIAAAVLDGRVLGAAELATIRAVAQGVASVLASSIESPGQAPLTSAIVAERAPSALCTAGCRSKRSNA